MENKLKPLQNKDYPKLRSCPFCGGKAEIHYQPIYLDEGVCIRCTSCKSRSKFEPCDCTYQIYHGKRDVFITKEQATNDVIALWNTRTEVDDGE